jgi:two-component system, chemotaxis family, chemotaxis protein CheY
MPPRLDFFEGNVMAVDKGIKILVVDDFENIALTLKSQLKKLGFLDVDVAIGGEDALEKIRSNREYGLFICDWFMNDVNGLKVLEQVRADEQLRKARFIMVTGNPQAEDVAAAKRAGVNGYVLKPYTIATLQQRIETVLN